MSAAPILVVERPAGPSAPGLQSEITRLVAELRQQRVAAAQQGIYRQLVACGLRAGGPVEGYRDKLIGAGLKESRASELAKILENPAVAVEFTHATKPISYRVALQRARGKGIKSDRSRSRRQQARLAEMGRELLKRHDAHFRWFVDCGLFRLSFVPHAPTGPAAPESATAQAEPSWRFVTSVAPDTEGKLMRLAHHSGLDRSETAAELLQRAALPPLLSPYEAPYCWHDPQREVRPVPAPEPDQANRRRAAEIRKRKHLFRLQRRKNPSRAYPDVCRVPVTLPGTRVDLLLAFADRCALSLGELANRLLEPEPAARLAEIAEALAAALGDRDETLRSQDPNGRVRRIT